MTSDNKIAKKKLEKEGVKEQLAHYLYRPLSPIVFWWSSLVLLVILLITIFNFFSLFQLKMDLQNALKQINQDGASNISQSFKGKLQKDGAGDNSAGDYLEIEEILSAKLEFNSETNTGSEKLEVGTEIELGESFESGKLEDERESINSDMMNNLIEVPIGGSKVSFSDIFSGTAYIDQKNTDLFWDDTMTAYSFPPVYDLTKNNDCSAKDCGLSRADIDPEKICLNGNCLRKDLDNILYYNEQKITLPAALRSELLVNISIFGLEKEWLVAFVSKFNGQDRARVYYFNGQSYQPIISHESEYKIETKYGRGGGKVYFGGDQADLFILYSGYEGFAYRLSKGVLEDLSRFFGLRVMSGGFEAQIFKLGTDDNADFYICGLNDHHPLVLKIWSDTNGRLVGALDFSSLLFQGDFKANNIICSLSDAKERELMIAVEKNAQSSLLSFKDLGFDISQLRKISSLNLNQNKDDIKAAVITDYNLSLDERSSFQSQFFLGNRAAGFEAVDPYLWYSFIRPGNQLYWRLELKPGFNKFYSPWFSDLNRLDYLFTE